MLAMLNQTATLERWTGTSGGKPTYAATETTPCRIEQTTQRVLSGQMAQQVSSVRMFVPPMNPIPTGSQVTVDGKIYKVGECAPIHGFFLSHLELMLI